MGHLVGKDIYRKLGKKIDNLIIRAPWNEAMYNMLKALYTTEEAEVIVKMPYGLATIEDIQKNTGIEITKLQTMMDTLAEKGLVMDLWYRNHFRYTISPLVVGIFEYTMMRTKGDLDSKEWAHLFHDYLQQGDAFYRMNFGDGQKVSPLRALPHEEVIDYSENVEVLDYEKASYIAGKARKFAIGICSCRHEKMHLGEKRCESPLEICASFNTAADFLIRHDMAREVSKEEMFENLENARNEGLVFTADNVQKSVSFMCLCCECCCNVLQGISKFGYPNTVVTSTFIARSDTDTCIQCGVCEDDCPINAIENGVDGNPVVLDDICLGCGVCGLNCETESMKLVKREQRVLHPENTFERVILQALERGNVQNLIFNNPQKITHSFMRGLLGGFFRLPAVKQKLMSDNLRSSFLAMVKRMR